MTPKLVRKLAQQAGAGDLGLSVASVFVRGLFERFADLVAAEVREECAQVCERMRTVPPNGEPEDLERGFNAALGRSAAAIRSLGKKEGV